MDLNNLFNAYSQYQKEHMSFNTYRARVSVIHKWLLPHLGKRDVRLITPDDLQAVYDYMEIKKLAPNSLYGAYSAFRSLFKYARERGYIDENPAAQTKSYCRTFPTQAASDPEKQAEQEPMELR